MTEYERGLFGNAQDDGEDQAPDLVEELSKALLAWTDILDSVRALAMGERAKLIDEGWDSENAEMMAMAVYGSFLNQLTGGIQK